eukprot:6189204-Pleurochrysis_carterae.AAC.2
MCCKGDERRAKALRTSLCPARSMCGAAWKASHATAGRSILPRGVCCLSSECSASQGATTDPDNN